MKATVLLVHADRVGIATGDAHARFVELPSSASLANGGAAAWSKAIASSVRGAVGGDLIVVIGLELLEIARPSIPPLDARARRAILTRDSDRYFPISGPAAVSWRDGYAFAIEESRLAPLIAELESIATVRGVFTAADMMAESGASESLLSHSSDGDATLVRAARRLGDAPVESQLLDGASAKRFASRRRNRWLASAAVLIGASVIALWSFDARAERALAEQRAAVERLREETARPRATLRRLQALTREIDLVATSRTSELSRTLDRLGRLLPTDAWVERLEWTGSEWRIDGSAANAPRLVPLLDGDAGFEGVRTVEATTRFLDRGRPRESFAIAFRVKDAQKDAQANSGGADD